jgi:hypothetical protein
VLTPDGKRLIAGTRAHVKSAADGRLSLQARLIVWSVKRGDELLRLPFPHGSIYGLAVAPNGASVAIASDGGLFLSPLPR